MVKKIANAFEYIDYRLLFNDDFLARSSANHSYSLRAYARDLDLSPSFVSDLLHGKRELSAATSADVFSTLGLDAVEVDYLVDIVKLKQTKDPIEKMNLSITVDRRHKKATMLNDASKDLIMKSVDHFLIHGLVGGESDRKKILTLSAQVGIAASRAVEVIGEMVLGGYLREENKQLFIENLNLHIPDHSRIFEIQRQFVNRMIDRTVETGGNRMPEQMGNFLVMGFDRHTFPLVGESYKHLINTLNRLSNQSVTAERYAFFSSTFFSFIANSAFDAAISPSADGASI